ncbi:MAG: hypothetical protein E7612_07335 [Ruminococcaceae bacterium]|nr:hypothetical protein [Oscillospiraceae bacterium]
MLRLVEGGLYSDAYEFIKSEILKHTNEGKKVLLIVPEQQAVVAEKEMIEFLPSSAPLTFEVTNFTRLADTVARRVGGISAKFADRGKEALIMWKTLTELSAFLTLTDGKEVGFGVVEKMLAAVSEMKNISATPELLASISLNEKIKTNTRLGEKLSDLSKVMSLYQKLLCEKYSDSKDEVGRLAEKLEKHTDVFDGYSFFITGFTSFTEPQYRVLSALMKSCELTVHLTISKRHYDCFEFSEIKNTKERLTRLADKASASKTLVSRLQNKEGANMYLAEACNLLWRNFGKIDNESLQSNLDRIRIFEASDPYEEADFVASDIKRQVMLGASYRDFAVVSRDGEKYSGILKSSFEKADIPAFISIRKDISSYEAVKLVYAAFASVREGFTRESVISYAKCGLSGISAEACDEFELYTETWQIQKSGFTNGIFWNMSPLGYDSKRSTESEAALIRINETRDKILDPLIKFKDNLDSLKTVREYAEALYGFLCDISLKERIDVQISSLLSLGEEELAKENSMLWDIICASLDSLVEVLGDTEITLAGFENQIRVVLSEADIGKIPSYYDSVTVGSADMIRLSDKKHIYLIGVNVGEFPRAVRDSSYFNERDKNILCELGLATDMNSEIAYARELFFFTRAFSAARESVTVIYSMRDESLSTVTPSEVIERFSAITENALKPVKISSLPLEERIYFPFSAIEFCERQDIREALIESGYERETVLFDKDVSNEGLRLSRDTVSQMYPSELALTQSRIESFVCCPFSYYLRYNIKLSENERAQFDARNIGTFIHAMLENFFGEISESGKSVADVGENEKAEIIERSAKKYLDSVIDKNNPTSRRTDILLDRLCRAAVPVINGLCDELRGCSFVPRFFELKIGRDDENLPSPASFQDKFGDNVYVYGSIDRVDTYKSGDDVFVRVIDYKTGAKDFSPEDIDEGKNLQMFLYLKSIVDTDNQAFRERLGVSEAGNIIPAGVIYVKTDMSDVTVAHADSEAEKAAIAKKQQRRGMILDDEESISAMNKNYLPVKFKKDGSPDSRSEKFLYTREGWAELGEKISDKIGEISEKMKSGEIPLSDGGKDSPCDFCSYAPICRKKT